MLRKLAWIAAIVAALSCATNAYACTTGGSGGKWYEYGRWDYAPWNSAVYTSMYVGNGVATDYNVNAGFIANVMWV